MVHTDVNLATTVKVLQPETPGFLSIFLERPRHFVFEAGDWIDIGFPNTKLIGGTTYSLASSPDEADLRITFREGTSPFKKALCSVKPGDKLVIDQYGNDYGFRLRPSRPTVLIAGGVGITPFRSMIKQMAEAGANENVRLLYLNTSPEFLFEAEFRQWQRQAPRLNLNFIVTKDLKRKDRQKLFKELLTNPTSYYYIAGSSAMIGHTMQILEALGATKDDIKIDDFGMI